MKAHPILLQRKYGRVINLFSEMSGITVNDALSFFYHSTTYKLMSEGISDLHCYSDYYLAEELLLEYEKERHYAPN